MGKIWMHYNNSVSWGVSFGDSFTTMKDRLEELQQRTQEFSEAASENTNPFSVEDDNDDSVVAGVITPQAVVFEEEPIIENFLSEAQQIRGDISVLETEVDINHFFFS